jgi:hypothetical protein
MNLSYVQKLLLAADPFAAIRRNFRGRKEKLSRDRHLTCKQREDISTGLQDSVTGPVSMAASPSDREAIGYEDEIASVLEDTGFKVEIDNAKRKPTEQEIPAGVEMTVKDKTIRPTHAYRIVQAFRRAGIAIATRLNAGLRNNNTLYITVGPKVAPALVMPTTRTAAQWRSKVLRSLLAKWKTKFASGLRRPAQGD